MGMAASQARLLTLTSRLANNELRSQTINNAKMRLSTQSAQASEAYINALNNATMEFVNYDQSGEMVKQPLTFNALTTYSAYNSQYGLVNNSGQLLVSEDEAKLFEKAGGNLNKYLESHGLVYDTTYFKEIGTLKNDLYPVPFNSIDPESLSTWYSQYGSMQNSYELEKYNGLESTYIDAKDYINKNMSKAKTEFVENRINLSDEEFAYNQFVALKNNITKTYNDDVWNDSDKIKTNVDTYLSNKKVPVAEDGSILSTNTVIETGFAISAEEKDGHNYIKSKDPISGKEANDFSVSSDRNTLYFPEDCEAIELPYRAVLVTNPSTLNRYYISAGGVNFYVNFPQYSIGDNVITSEYTEPQFYLSYMSNSKQLEPDDYNKVIEALRGNNSNQENCTDLELIINAANEQYRNNGMVLPNSLPEYKKSSNKNLTFTRDEHNYENNISAYNICQRLFLDLGIGFPTVSGSFNNTNRLLNGAVIHKTGEHGYYYLDENNNLLKDIEYTGDKAKSKVTEWMNKVREFFKNDIDEYKFLTYNNWGSIDVLGKAVQDYYYQGINPYFDFMFDTEAMKEAHEGDNSYNLDKDLYDTFYKKLNIAAGDDSYANMDTILQALKNVDPAKYPLSSGFETVVQSYIIENLIDTYGEPKYTWLDENDYDNTENAEVKTQWYTNLFNRMKSGYKVLEDGLASSQEWLEYAFRNGIVNMEQVDKSYEWKSLDYKTCTRITEVTDEAAVAKAEAEYTRAMNDIKAKDNIFDIQLKNIDTEHSALQTEYDSIKNVLNKNMERTMKFNQNG